MPKQFKEDLGHEEYDPALDTRAQEFDWEALEQRLGESGGELSEHDLKKLATAVNAMLDWLIRGDLRHKQSLRAIGKRAVAMAWVMNPERFGDKASLHSVSSMMGFKAANLSPLTAEFSRLFSLFNKYQNHDWRKDK